MTMKLDGFPAQRIVASFLTLALSGCGGFAITKNAVDQAVSSQEQQIASLKMPATPSVPAPYVEYTDRPFLGATSIPRPTTESLPAGMNDVTLVFSSRLPINEIAALIAQATGIPVSIASDVFAVGANGIPISPSQQGSGTGSGMGMPGAVTAVLNYRGHLSKALDGVASQINASWRYKDGQITFYRYETRTFNVPYFPIKDAAVSLIVGASASASMGTSTGSSGGTSSTGGTTGSSGSSGGVSGSVTGTFATSMSYNYKPWADLEAGLKGILSPQGKAVVMGSAGAVTITDTPRQIELASQLIQDINRFYGRQVGIKVQVVTLNLNESSEFGVNWNLILNVLNAAGNQTQYALAGPAGSSLTTAASAGVTLIRQVNGTKDFSGSSALLRALSTVGKVHVQRTWESLTLNRRVVPVAAVRTTAYLAQTTPAVASVAGATATAPGLTPGSVTYGFTLQMVPTITSQNTVVLDFGLNLSDLKGMTQMSSGSGSSQQTIELPETIANQIVQSVTMGTGDTLVLSGLQQDSSQYTRTGLDRDAPVAVGGLFQGATEKSMLLVLVTPVVADYQ